MDPPKTTTVAVTSDRGLCGGLNSNITKYTRTLMKLYTGENWVLSCLPVDIMGMWHLEDAPTPAVPHPLLCMTRPWHARLLTCNARLHAHWPCNRVLYQLAVGWHKLDRQSHSLRWSHTRLPSAAHMLCIAATTMWCVRLPATICRMQWPACCLPLVARHVSSAPVVLPAIKQ